MKKWDGSDERHMLFINTLCFKKSHTYRKHRRETLLGLNLCCRTTHFISSVSDHQLLLILG